MTEQNLKVLSHFRAHYLHAHQTFELHLAFGIEVEPDGVPLSPETIDGFKACAFYRTCEST